AVHLRRPGWASGDAFRVAINGEGQRLESQPSSYLTLEREWRDGDEIEVELPMRVSIEPLKNLEEYAAVLYGPIVLAAVTDRDDLAGLVAGEGRMDHIASGALRPLDKAPMLVCEQGDLPRLVERDEASRLEF